MLGFSLKDSCGQTVYNLQEVILLVSQSTTRRLVRASYRREGAKGERLCFAQEGRDPARVKKSYSSYWNI